jgi:SAM-dependent methyltransferase
VTAACVLSAVGHCVRPARGSVTDVLCTRVGYGVHPHGDGQNQVDNRGRVVRVQQLLRPDRFPLSSQYEPAWLLELDMGPHPLWQLEDLLVSLGLRPGDRVLDLGCGRGATSVFLAREADVEVVALDRWVGETQLQAVIDAAGVAEQVEVRRGDVRALPFDDAEFDAIVSIDAFEYFGTDVHLLPSLLRVLRPGGRIGVSTPALKLDPYERTPPALVTSLVGWEAAAWHAPRWWQRHWELTGLLTEVTARMQPGSRDDWIMWARATGEVDNGPLLTMLTSMGPDEIGFALLTAVNRDPSPRPMSGPPQ